MAAMSEKAFVYIVTDGPGAGNPDMYGVFSTQALAEAYVQRQRDRGYPFSDGLAIEETPLDEARDLGAWLSP
jgi:hypothetical protein